MRGCASSSSRHHGRGSPHGHGRHETPSGLHGASEQVAELKGLDEVRVPDHAAVLDANLREHLVDFVDPRSVVSDCIF
jgi:hypothetical protein